MEGPQNGWFTKENPTTMDDLGYPYFGKPPFLCKSFEISTLSSDPIRPGVAYGFECRDRMRLTEGSTGNPQLIHTSRNTPTWRQRSRKS